jgi:hypothetical protein
MTTIQKLDSDKDSGDETCRRLRDGVLSTVD